MNKNLALLSVLLVAALAYLLVILAPSWKFADFPEGGYFVFDSESPNADERPVRRILFLGSSHTFYFRMPLMVRKLAESAGVPERYSISMYAQPGATLASLWQDKKTHELLWQNWDVVVLQGHPSTGLVKSWEEEYLMYGKQYVALARKAGAQPIVYIPWAIADNSEYFQNYPQLRAKRLRSEGANARLAYDHGLPIANAARVVEKMLVSQPEVSLYMEDGIHGTAEAYYMAALLIFQTLSGKSAAETDYVPPGISGREDAAIKAMVVREMPAGKQ